MTTLCVRPCTARIHEIVCRSFVVQLRIEVAGIVDLLRDGRRFFARERKLAVVAEGELLGFSTLEVWSCSGIELQ